ncbi:MAG: nucleoside-diphosphate kinase [Anaerolineaceae bacterium]|nr:nucleoside-diphosphate kinase [Anaerolineaceae bacterium]
MQKTLVLVKPDGVQRGLVGEVISRLEKRGLKMLAARFLQISRELAETHYAEHQGKPFYKGLINYITSAPSLAMVWEAPNAVSVVRQIIGATNPSDAAPGSIRNDFCLTTGRNLTHASDTPENAQLEISLWFNPDDLVEWTRCDEPWTFLTN